MKVRRSLLLSGLSAAAVMLAWWWWPAHVAAPLDRGSPEAKAPVLATDAGNAPAAVPPPVRTEAAQTEGLRVRVRDRTGAPVVGAPIRVTGDDQLRIGPTDAEGLATSSRFPAGNVVLYVDHEHASGFATWYWDARFLREVTVWLQPDRDVEVTVLDTSGRALAGIEVRVMAADELWYQTRLAGTTDEHGLARIPVPGRDLLAAKKVVRAMADVGGRQFETAAAPWQSGAPTVLAITAEAPPPSPVLTVRFVDATGAPAAVHGSLEWSLTAPIMIGYEPLDGEVAANGEFALLPHLGPGNRVWIRLVEPGRLPGRVAVQMPARPVPHEVTLVRGPMAPRLEVPLIHPDGAAVISGEYALYVRFGPIDGMSRRAQPDPRGLLTMSILAETSGKLEIAHCRREGQLYEPAVAGLERPYNSGAAPPPPDPVIAVLPFGAVAREQTVRLPPVVVPRLLAQVRGRVVDEAGQPVAAVKIGITTAARPVPKEYELFSAHTDAAGEFLIEAVSLPEELFVFGRRPLGFCAPVRVRPAANELVELTMLPCGALECAVKVPPGLLGPDLRPLIVLVVDDAQLRDGWWAFFAERQSMGRWELFDRWNLTMGVPDDGRLVLRDLVPASYEVRGCLGANQALVVPGVQVTSGETTRLPAAFGDGLERTCVRVLDADGAPLTEARVSFRIPEWEQTLPRGADFTTDAKGEAWFVAPRNAVADVEIVAQGRAPRRCPSAGFPLEVKMSNGATIALAIGGRDAVLPGVRALIVSCREHGEVPPDSPLYRDTQDLHHPLVHLDANGRGSIPNLPPGTYRLWLAAIPPIGSARGTTFVLLGDRTLTGDGVTELSHELTTAEQATLLGR